MKDITEILKTKTSLPLAKKTVLNVSFASNHFKDGILSVLKPHDISIEQFNVLRILRGKNGEPSNLKDIQDRMISKMSNTTRLVDKLILKNLVERFTCEKNRRKVDIYITDGGLKLLELVDPIIEEKENELTNNLSKKELKTLNLLLTKMRG
ncbi:MarR family winged helix-turn-helix transcriptional regulator [Winogradskyella sp. MH6]|uniref:MarR family winged helix-turn-helix transcriptional regulator n=1 Tax=Winogradskyella sp. MH6 TaxID=2929510 RepID=UPI001FB4DB92|nr:MarR family transcriptional regulator [Winogradskyella sp. MH6]